MTATVQQEKAPREWRCGDGWLGDFLNLDALACMGRAGPCPPVATLATSASARAPRWLQLDREAEQRIVRVGARPGAVRPPENVFFWWTSGTSGTASVGPFSVEKMVRD